MKKRTVKKKKFGHGAPKKKGVSKQTDRPNQTTIVDLDSLEQLAITVDRLAAQCHVITRDLRYLRDRIKALLPEPKDDIPF